MSLKQDIHHFLNLYFVAFMSCRFTWENFDYLNFVLILVALLIQYVTSGRWGPVDLGPSHTRFGGLRLGQGASCPLSLCGPPPARGCFLCICLLVPPWIGYVIVSIECGLEFFMLWGGCWVPQWLGSGISLPWRWPPRGLVKTTKDKPSQTQTHTEHIW